MRQRRRTSRTAKRALTALVLAVTFSGCQSPPEAPPSCVLSDEDFHAYVRSVETRVRELGLAQSASVPDDLREQHRTAARSFLASLNEYASALDALEARASSLKPEDVASSTTRFARLRGALTRATSDARDARDAVLGLYESSRAAADGGASIPGLETPPAYVSASAELSARLAASNDYLASRHLRGLEAAGLGAPPAIVVLHVVSLAGFAELDLRAHADRYQKAWRAWMRAVSRGRDFASALEIYEIAAAGEGPLRVDSVQELTGIAHMCVESATGLAALARMDEALDRLDRSLAVRPDPPAGWDRTATNLRAALLLARAAKTDDARRKLELATKARAMSNDFQAESAKVFAIAAYVLGSEAAGERRFTDSVRIYRQTLEAGSVEDIDYHVDRFRSAVFRRALDRVTEDLRHMRVDEAQSTAAQLAEIASDDEDASQAKKTLRRVQHSLVDHFRTRDVDRALTVALEALKENPVDAKMRRKADECRLFDLRNGLGDLATSWDRLGARKTREMLHTASLVMSSRGGLESCRSVFREVEAAWVGQSRRTYDPEVAFRLALELAVLRGHEGDAGTSQAASALWHRLDEAVERRDWELLESTVVVYFDRCPSVPRPERFKTSYLLLLEHLDGLEEIDRLGRHLARYAVAYPRDLDSISKLLDKHMVPESEIGRPLSVVVRRVAPQTRSLERFASDASGDADPGGADSVSLISQAELARSVGWWNEPANEPERPVERTPAGDSLAARPDYASVGYSGLGIGLFSLLALGWHTRRCGVLPFACYASAALLLGAGGGFLLGLL